MCRARANELFLRPAVSYLNLLKTIYYKESGKTFHVARELL
jgi:hypothetical protein